jgi:hypothetical protein
MSLISGANFVAPLRSKVQVVGIFALAVLVAVLRLVDSGESDPQESSRVSRRTTVSADVKEEPSVAEQVDAFIASRQKAKALKPSSGAIGDIEVDQLLDGADSRAAAGRKPAPDSDDDSAEPKNLNDIMRRLE